MTKEEFIAGYCARSGISRATFDACRKALPCACGADECLGWAAVGRDMEETHMELYAPKAEVKP